MAEGRERIRNATSRDGSRVGRPLSKSGG